MTNEQIKKHYTEHKAEYQSMTLEQVTELIRINEHKEFTTLEALSILQEDAR